MEVVRKLSHDIPPLSFISHSLSFVRIARSEEVAIVESRLCCDDRRRLQMLIVVDRRMVKVPMIIEIRQLHVRIHVRLLKVNASLF